MTVPPAVASAEPEIVVPHREAVIYLLTEAAEIEHGLMCCYLFAAFSLKRDEPELLPEERAALARWRESILAVARDEMVHLALVSNLLSSLGGAAHFGRPNFPVAPGYHPAGVVVSLAPFDRATLAHFIYLERPEGVALPDGKGFRPFDYQRGGRAGALVPSAQDYGTVGHLYRGVRRGLAALVERHGDTAVFVGDPRHQVGPEVLQMNGLSKVRSLADAEAAIDTIVRQGEGAAGDGADNSHYARFRAMAEEYESLLASNPSFVPARPVARNPVMRRPPEPEGKVWISAEPAADLLDLANAAYALMLRSLAALFSPVSQVPDASPGLCDLALLSMRLITPLAELLTTLPAQDGADRPTAGMTFTMTRSLHAPPDARGLRVVSESARSLAAAVAKLDSVPASAQRTALAIDELGVTLGELSARPAVSLATVQQEPTAPKPPPPPPGAAGPGVEVARGKALTLLFEAKRCIHSRGCVLDAPGVFLANTPGEWIFPDAATAETLVGVAHGCPSGAIRYERHDGGPEESAPPVNVARIRENGPLAISAELHLTGHGAMYRATLCRCGASKNKPFCDGAHAAAGFSASGEPATLAADPLPKRNGALAVTPARNGPLVVRGNLELCAGTGRVVARVTEGAFCRCGGSKTKPFCDGTHAAIGFVAEGKG